MSWWRKDHLSSVLYNAQVFIWTPVVKKHSTFVLITTSQKHWKPESAQLFSSGTHKQNDTPLMRCHVTLRRGFLFSSPCCWCCRGGDNSQNRTALDWSALQRSVNACVRILIVMSFGLLSTYTFLEGDTIMCVGDTEINLDSWEW